MYIAVMRYTSTDEGAPLEDVRVFNLDGERNLDLPLAEQIDLTADTVVDSAVSTNQVAFADNAGAEVDALQERWQPDTIVDALFPEPLESEGKQHILIAVRPTDAA